MTCILGAHMSTAGGVYRAFERADNTGCSTFQIFLKNSNQWNAKPYSNEEILFFKTNKEKTGIWPAVAHDSYLINLASYDKQVLYKSQIAFEDEILRASQLSIPFIVMHPGSHLGAGYEEGIDRISESLNIIFDKTNKPEVMVLLETTAGQGTNIGYRFEHIAKIIEKIKERERVGVCLDTCHIFAAGYDILNYEKYIKTFEEFDALIGIKKLKVVHLNDSKKGLGSRVDRHEHIGKGALGLKPFEYLLNDIRLQNIPLILETPKGIDENGIDMDIVNLNILRNLIK